MATIVCGWCGDRCHMTSAGQPVVNPWNRIGTADEQFIADAAYTCDGCKRMSVVTWTTRYDPTDTTWRRHGREGDPEPYENAKWSPSPGHQKTFSDVPPLIADLATEAWTCRSAGANRGAIALARAVVESTAKARGFTTGTIQQKIDALAEARIIRPALAEQAHQIRHFGNDVAHGDLVEPANSAEAEEVLELMGEVLNEVWQAPARAERLAVARAARRDA